MRAPPNEYENAIINWSENFGQKIKVQIDLQKGIVSLSAVYSSDCENMDKKRPELCYPQNPSDKRYQG